jgi:di/tricarboxylate transporter
MILNIDQIMLLTLVSGVLVFLLWGKVRYDVVAFAALIIGVLFSLIPKEEAFSGFGHPATVIIALVLIVSRGLSNSGAVELIARYLSSGTRNITTHVGIMSAIAGGLSALMNNVAALALLMPVDAEAAKRSGRSPSLTMMPLSFATILGGMVTLIGTPPNIIIAIYREENFGEPFGLFDFAPVGIVIAFTGIVFITFIGWRLLPKARTKHNVRQELQDMAGFVSEAKIPEGSDLIGSSLRDLFSLAEGHDIALLGIIRQGQRLPGSGRKVTLRQGDFIVMEGAAASTETFVGAAELEFLGVNNSIELLGENQSVIEVVVPVGADIEGRSAMNLQLSYRQGIILLGVSRQGIRFRDRVRKLKIKAGDILLLAGPADRLSEVVDQLGCLPLAERGLKILQRRKSGLAIATFAIGIILTSIGLVDMPVALGAVAIVYLITGIVPITELYESIEWPVIILLGSMIPIGMAIESSGITAVIATGIIDVTSDSPMIIVLLLLMVITMTLSDILNNVATVLIAAPISIQVAHGFGVNPDTFLMAVAVSASCAFLTPIGHKNNTIVMGPGGYRFGDYWRMGLPLEILVIAVGLPMILLVWPL